MEKKGSNNKKEEGQKNGALVVHEVLRIYFNANSLDPFEPTKEQQQCIADITRFWLVKHGCPIAKLSKGGGTGYYTISLIVIGILMLLLILKYLPV